MINPVRYPGGKGRKAIVDRVLSLYPDGYFVDKTWIEPFAGGCGLGIALLERQAVKQCIFADYDNRISDMWLTIAYDSEHLIDEIDKLDVNIETFHNAKRIANEQTSTSFERGFNTYILNRCARSGYIDGGAIGGNDQKGNYKVDCRFNKKTLTKNIRRIAKLAEEKKFVFLGQHEANELIETYPQQYDNPFLYVDPPYYDKGSVCYKTRVDHKELCETLQNTPYEWLLSYDNVPEIRDMYSQYRMEPLDITYSNNTQTRGNTRELLILSQLGDTLEEN
jgi:DNA adenine methylase